jgi:hypothetical protein
VKSFCQPKVLRRVQESDWKQQQGQDDQQQAEADVGVEEGLQQVDIYNAIHVHKLTFSESWMFLAESSKYTTVVPNWKSAQRLLPSITIIRNDAHLIHVDKSGDHISVDEGSSEQTLPYLSLSTTSSSLRMPCGPSQDTAACSACGKPAIDGAGSPSCGQAGMKCT